MGGEKHDETDQAEVNVDFIKWHSRRIDSMAAYQPTESKESEDDASTNMGENILFGPHRGGRGFLSGWRTNAIARYEQSQDLEGRPVSVQGNITEEGLESIDVYLGACSQTNIESYSSVIQMYD